MAPQPSPANTSGREELSPVAEAKRLDARRRFLLRGTAAGSGFLIVTLFHQRAVAETRVVSSELACNSFGGVIGTQVENPSVPGQTRFNCNI